MRKQTQYRIVLLQLIMQVFQTSPETKMAVESYLCVYVGYVCYNVATKICACK